MSNPNSNDHNSLCFFLKLCEFDPSRTKDILKYYGSITDFFKNFNLPNSLPFALTTEEKKQIVRYANLKRRAELDLEEALIVHGEDLTLEKVLEYSFTVDDEEHLRKRRKEIYEANKEAIDKIYEHELNKMKAVPRNGNYVQILLSSSLNVFQSMAKLAKQYPFISKKFYTNFISISDDILGTIGKYGPVSVNLASAIIIFCSLSAYSIGSNLIRYYKEKDRGTFTFQDCLWCFISEIAIIGVSSGITFIAGSVGGLIGIGIPIIGPHIGGIVGSLIGLLMSNKLIETAFDNLQKKLVLQKLKPDCDKSLYLETLKKLDIDENTKVDCIKSLQMEFRKIHLPDKDITDEKLIKEKTKRFFEKEVLFRIVEAYRKANNTWQE